jgi:hypothetical protein
MRTKQNLLRQIIREEVRKQVNESFPYDDPVYTELVSIEKQLLKVIELANNSNYNNVSRSLDRARDMVIKAGRMMINNKQ